MVFVHQIGSRMSLDCSDIQKYFLFKSEIVNLTYHVKSCKYNSISIMAEASDGQHIYFFNKALSYPTHMDLVLIDQTVVPFSSR